MAVPKRPASVSQFWLPALLFILSVFSIVFTLHTDDEIPVIHSSERSIQAASELDASRSIINQALQASTSWRSWCENSGDTLRSLRFANFEPGRDSKQWSELRRFLPQREQDALLRCQNAGRRKDGHLHNCLFLNPKDLEQKDTKTAELHLVELTLELRSIDRKKVFSCAEALAAGEQPMEMAAWYTYYWTGETEKKPLRFERLTGGTRIFPPLAQNAD